MFYRISLVLVLFRFVETLISLLCTLYCWAALFYTGSTIKFINTERKVVPNTDHVSITALDRHDQAFTAQHTTRVKDCAATLEARWEQNSRG